ncbi:MAG TPA: hypothetical protein DEF89_21640 [Desulfosporosinus sp.]|nr:hypothetical protein [Desulfosporosinus sp.]
MLYPNSRVLSGTWKITRRNNYMPHRILYKSLHTIDRKRDNPETRTLADDEGDINTYIVDSVGAIVNQLDNRSFVPESQTTEVINTICLYQNQQMTFEGLSDIVANRLLREEKKAQERYKAITEIRKGSLIQAFIENDDMYLYLVAKVEHDTYIDDIELVKRVGMPVDKQTIKTGLITFSQDMNVLSVKISDVNAKASQYWWGEFLELRKANTDEDNTKKAFKAIDIVLGKQIKTQSPKDHTVLRNTAIGFFRNEENFSFDNMMNSVFNRYEPIEPDSFDIQRVRDTISRLPEQGKFDRQFVVVKKEIRANIKQVYHISPNIELQIIDHVEAIRHLIQAERSEDGSMYIKIKTDSEEVFQSFNF